jgi:PAS domain S-box-containing protein
VAWQFNPYAIPLFVAAGILISFILVVARRRSGLALTLFLLFMLDIAGLCITYGLELLSANLRTILIWIKTEYLFSQTIPVVWLMFVAVYTRTVRRPTLRRAAVLLILPAVQILLVATNEFHHLNWATTSTRRIGDIVLFERTYGAVFWLSLAYLYGLVGVSVVLLLRAINKSTPAFRRQLVPLLIGSLFPWMADILSLLRITPLPGMDLIPFALALTCVPLAWSVFRLRLFDLVPAAYDNVVKSMSDAVIVLDSADQVVDINPAAARLIGRSPEELIGGLAQLELEPSIPAIGGMLNTWESTGEITFEVSGAIRSFDVRISPLQEGHRRYSGRVMVIRDSTERKQAEETIRTYAQELEERNRDLDSFNDTVAHDLRAPLHLVIGYAGLLLDTDPEALPPDVIAYMQEIQRSGWKMNEMVQSLLVLARLRDVRQEITRVPSLPVVRSAIARFQDRIDMRGIQIDVARDLPPAMCHSTWLEEIFANLIGNAITYIGKNNPDPRIRIEGRKVNGMVRYEVSDNGVGIRPEVQHQLFEMFTRLHPAEGHGLGMGLSIVQRIVTRLEGEVGVESQEGQGSTFWFMLPCPDESDARIAGNGHLKDG